jgi:hypothetical protein
MSQPKVDQGIDLMTPTHNMSSYLTLNDLFNTDVDWSRIMCEKNDSRNPYARSAGQVYVDPGKGDSTAFVICVGAGVAGGSGPSAKERAQHEEIIRLRLKLDEQGKELSNARIARDTAVNENGKLSHELTQANRLAGAYSHECELARLQRDTAIKDRERADKELMTFKANTTKGILEGITCPHYSDKRALTVVVDYKDIQGRLDSSKPVYVKLYQEV